MPGPGLRSDSFISSVVEVSFIEQGVVGVKRVGVYLLFLKQGFAELKLHHLEHGGLEVAFGQLAHLLRRSVGAVRFAEIGDKQDMVEWSHFHRAGGVAADGVERGFVAHAELFRSDERRHLAMQQAGDSLFVLIRLQPV